MDHLWLKAGNFEKKHPMVSWVVHICMEEILQDLVHGSHNLLVLNVGNGWEWGNGMIIDGYCGSFPHLPTKHK